MESDLKKKFVFVFYKSRFYFHEEYAKKNMFLYLSFKLEFCFEKKLKTIFKTLPNKALVF